MLKKIGLCLSSMSTWKLLDTLGMRHDELLSRPSVIFNKGMSSYLLSYAGLHISCPNGTRL